MKLRKLNCKLITIPRKHHLKLLLLMLRKLRLIKLPRKLLSQMHQSTLKLLLKDKLTLLPRLIKMPKMHRLKLMLLPPKLPKLQFKITN
jgi:hypothetical protein